MHRRGGGNFQISKSTVSLPFFKLLFFADICTRGAGYVDGTHIKVDQLPTFGMIFKKNFMLTGGKKKIFNV